MASRRQPAGSFKTFVKVLVAMLGTLSILELAIEVYGTNPGALLGILRFNVRSRDASPDSSSQCKADVLNHWRLLQSLWSRCAHSVKAHGSLVTRTSPFSAQARLADAPMSTTAVGSCWADLEVESLPERYRPPCPAPTKPAESSLPAGTLPQHESTRGHWTGTVSEGDAQQALESWARLMVFGLSPRGQEEDAPWRCRSDAGGTIRCSRINATELAAFRCNHGDFADQPGRFGLMCEGGLKSPCTVHSYGRGAALALDPDLECSGIEVDPSYGGNPFASDRLVQIRAAAPYPIGFTGQVATVINPALLREIWEHDQISALAFDCGGCETALGLTERTEALLPRVRQVSLVLHADDRRLTSRMQATGFGRLLVLLREAGHQLIGVDFRRCRSGGTCSAVLAESTNTASINSLLGGRCCIQLLFIRGAPPVLRSTQVLFAEVLGKVDEASKVARVQELMRQHLQTLPEDNAAAKPTPKPTPAPSLPSTKGEHHPAKLWREDGRCGAPHLVDAEGDRRVHFYAECDPASSNPCCSRDGFCGKSAQHCRCNQCYDFRMKGRYESSCTAVGTRLDPNSEGKIAPLLSKPQIPKILHQVWLGSDKPPPYWLRTCKRLFESRGWTYILWTSHRVEAELGKSFRTYRQFHERKDFIGRADIIRYVILEKYGGVYFDADSACLKPIDWLDVNVDTECWLSQEYRKWKDYAANGFIGCVKNSKMIRAFNDAIATDNNINGHDAWIQVGPKFVNELFKRHGGGHYDRGLRSLSVTVLSYCLFLPDHWLDLENGHLKNRHIARLEAHAGGELEGVLEQFRDEYASSYTYQFWGSTFKEQGATHEHKVQPRQVPDRKWHAGMYECGRTKTLINIGGKMLPAQCDPLSNFPCCSALGYCGSSPSHCDCDNCVDYRTEEQRESSETQALDEESTEAPDKKSRLQELPTPPSVDKLLANSMIAARASMGGSTANSQRPVPASTGESTADSQTRNVPKVLWLVDSDKCGKKNPIKVQGGKKIPAQCNPKSDRPCCSNLGWCGISDAHCLCDGCVDYRQNQPDAVEPSSPTTFFLHSFQRVFTSPPGVKSACEPVQVEVRVVQLLDCLALCETLAASGTACDTVAVAEGADRECGLQNCGTKVRWSREVADWRGWRVHARSEVLKSTRSFLGAPAYDLRRDDLEVIEGTALTAHHASAGFPAKEEPAPKGLVYPLVTRLEYDGSSKGWSISDGPAVSKRNVAGNDCAVGEIVLGIMSTPQDRKARDRQRHVVSQIGSASALAAAPLCLYFRYAVGIVGVSRDALERLKAEKSKYNDLELLHIAENMNSGKTFAWLDHAFRQYPRAKFIAKMDTDSFIHPHNLVQQLASLPDSNLFYGFDCGHNGIRQRLGSTVQNVGAFTGFGHRESPVTWDETGKQWRRPMLFLCGMFYLFSRDLLQCVIKSSWTHQHTKGDEDVTTASWLLHAHCPVNYAVDMYRFFDYGGPSGGSYWIRPGWHRETVCIHKLKSDEAWNSMQGFVASSLKRRAKVVISIPYRDREGQWATFMRKFEDFVRSSGDLAVESWIVYAVEQFDDGLFNRGWLFNVGLDLALRQASTDGVPEPDCGVIHDVDMIPEVGVDYSMCPVPIQLSSEIDRWGWSVAQPHYTGGVVSMSPKHWRAVNGFPNDFFGWGGEDDDLLQRLNQNKLAHGVNTHLGKAISRPAKGKGRFSSVNAGHSLRIARSEKELIKQVEGIQKGSAEEKLRWKRDGLNTLRYTVISEDVWTSQSVPSIEFHRPRIRRGDAAGWHLHEVQILVTSSPCGGNSDKLWWPLGQAVPKTVLELRALIGAKPLPADCKAGANWIASAGLAAVDLAWSNARLLSDSDDDTVVAFLRQLFKPSLGVILVEPRGPDFLKASFRDRVAIFPEDNLFSTRDTTMVCWGHRVGKNELQPTKSFSVWDMFAGKSEPKATGAAQTVQLAPCNQGHPDEWRWAGAFLALRKAQRPDDKPFCIGRKEGDQTAFRLATGSNCEGTAFGVRWQHVGSFFLPENLERETMHPAVPSQQVCISHDGGRATISIVRDSSCGKQELALRALTLADWSAVWDRGTVLLEKNRKGCHLFICSKLFLGHEGGRFVDDHESGNDGTAR